MGKRILKGNYEILFFRADKGSPHVWILSSEITKEISMELSETSPNVEMNYDPSLPLVMRSVL
jgi:hypothetical protein